MASNATSCASGSHRYRNLVVVDGSHSEYDRTEVMDVSHLNRRGAVVYSMMLGDIIRARLGAGPAEATRWLELPRFAATATAAVIEEIAQSPAEVTSRK